jgi:hypothetical protein
MVSTHLCLGLHCGIFFLRLSHQYSIRIPRLPIRAKYHTHLISFGFVILTASEEDDNL